MCYYNELLFILQYLLQTFVVIIHGKEYKDLAKSGTIKIHHTFLNEKRERERERDTKLIMSMLSHF